MTVSELEIRVNTAACLTLDQPSGAWSADSSVLRDIVSDWRAMREALESVVNDTGGVLTCEATLDALRLKP